MVPKKVKGTSQEHLFRSRLDNMICMDHELVKLSRLSRWRNRIGEDGCGLLLRETIEAATHSKALPHKEFRKVNVDTTVQEKNIAFPTDAKLLDAARRKILNWLRDLFARFLQGLLIRPLKGWLSTIMLIDCRLEKSV